MKLIPKCPKCLLEMTQLVTRSPYYLWCRYCDNYFDEHLQAKVLLIPENRRVLAPLVHEYNRHDMDYSGAEVAATLRYFMLTGQIKIDWYDPIALKLNYADLEKAEQKAKQ